MGGKRIFHSSRTVGATLVVALGPGNIPAHPDLVEERHLPATNHTAPNTKQTKMGVNGGKNNFSPRSLRERGRG